QPVLAAELALAAWRSDPTSTAAGTALAGRYLAFADTEKIIAAQADPISIFAGGDVAMVSGLGGRDRASILTGVLGDHPARHDPPFELDHMRQSTDGRFVAVLSADGTVHLVDTTRGVEPVLLADPGPGTRFISGFDPAVERLAWLDRESDGRSALTVHDLDDGTTSTTTLDIADLTGLQLTADPDVVLVRTGTTEDFVLTVRSLRTGVVLRDVTQSWMVSEKYDVRCVPGDGTPGSTSSVIAFDTVTGVEQRRIPLLSTCSNFWLTEDMRHVLERIQSPVDQERWRA